MAISALPAPPQRTQTQAEFSAKADALLAALNTFVAEANALQTDVNSKQVSTANSAGESASYRDESIAARNLAQEAVADVLGMANIVLSAGSLATYVSYSARTSNSVLSTGDRAKILDCTTAFTQTVQDAATLGANWFCYLRNSSAGVFVIDPNASEQINAANTLSIYPGELYLLICSGTGFNAVLLNTVMRSVNPANNASVQANSVNDADTTSAIKTLVLPVPSLVKNGIVVKFLNNNFTWANNNLTINLGSSSGTSMIHGEASPFTCNSNNAAAVTLTVIDTDSATFIKWGVSVA
jgi:hypothetical protein